MDKTLKKKVEYILTTEPETRNSDITLTIKLWKHYYPDYLIESKGKFYINVESLFEIAREDHIKRYRAEIQNVEKRYLPTDMKILIQRAKLSIEWQKELGYSTLWQEADWEYSLKKYLEPKQGSMLY